MSYNKSNRPVSDKRDYSEVVELENQFILRLPEEPAKVLREALKNGVASLKDRFTIQLEDDMRYGEVRIDHFLMHAKVVDLPTIVESLKTIDNRSFYKTADICQMMICKEEPDILSTDEESPLKNKKKDPNKVDKKFLWPHGITPPTKNVRRRRFRKTLKKKYVEAPEIEKEVKRLLREDNDAVSVKWEIISEDDDQIKQDIPSGMHTNVEEDSSNKMKNKSIIKSKTRPMSYTGVQKNSPLVDSRMNTESSYESTSRLDLVEHDIFGGAVSDSEEEDTNINIDIDDNSRLSADDTTMNDSSSLQGAENDDKLVTSFSSEMFYPSSSSGIAIEGNHYNQNNSDENVSRKTSSKADNLEQSTSCLEQDKSSNNSGNFVDRNTPKDMLMSRIEEIREQLQELQSQKLQKQREVDNMENAALQQRFQEMLKSLEEQIRIKEMEYENLQSMLN
ncbi:transcription initiation factor TFIID subunit 7 [Ctenocephalides felis]|uniref:transcription initiation factor TFIID subunit 7 n=1 Tax=Ctenocephalides felis TaxID=7515 RepID=UPI000E6E141E|nr:transcription initiation factor TFIID subunit 7 [Ctenocephalides felis]